MIVIIQSFRARLRTTDSPFSIGPNFRLPLPFGQRDRFLGQPALSGGISQIRKQGIGTALIIRCLTKLVLLEIQK